MASWGTGSVGVIRGIPEGTYRVGTPLGVTVIPPTFFWFQYLMQNEAMVSTDNMLVVLKEFPATSELHIKVILTFAAQRRR